jgi:hypothetical protein
MNRNRARPLLHRIPDATHIFTAGAWRDEILWERLLD